MNENNNKNERLRPSMQLNKKKKSHVGRGIEEVQVIDFFSGCGGMSFGFHTATTRNVKYHVLGGLDIDRHANATYERMLKKPAIMNDIRRLTDRESLEEALSQWGYDSSKPLILIGCAPCQGFSSHRKKDPREDERNELLAAFGDIVLALEPALVVMENVPEMLQKKYWKHYEAFSSKLEEHGYITRARLHNLASFGVPQERYRALVLSSRLSHRTE
ncbi:MAG: DNA cytosine methyltransferase, partial [Chrysiogenetes bacterium]|nr:DNA cytosine methyltransferase [Chrysiogenetes bacterium]